MRMRKFLALPLHHIDTSVLIEPEKTEDGRYCRKYLQKIGYNYRGTLSFPVLSELFLKIVGLEVEEEKLIILRFIAYLRKYKHVTFYSPKKIADILKDLNGLDNRLGPIDTNIIAASIEHKARNLVTLDKQLVHHKSVEEKFGLTISHPKEFI
ncbi:MAG: type II toxin-antitoxin system VapC family toxin [Candidatus Aenigmarchaeota archaeon]|nr:type II toxin-antitoxin system VapC family toxin [Candidatus Aenigmarchaeota archaeon]